MIRLRRCEPRTPVHRAAPEGGAESPAGQVLFRAQAFRSHHPQQRRQAEQGDHADTAAPTPVSRMYSRESGTEGFRRR
ncbi:hypothetical protein QF030_007622 [Streptomyces rishiriensis]|uniref:Uncharacterized protein n=1 Tax=Streptomyces rishiriensis TaxID=68264 RepID=A0ABU0P254_STRRH|nr:hypothetical protein [Streptomyces rishiriensis]